jgi:hypothetical protein
MAAKVPLTPLLIGAACLVALAAGVAYLNRPASKPADNGPATAESKAYLKNLRLSDVDMTATENFMKQQVVEVQGNITNAGPRPLASVDVFCLFYGIDGQEIYRERLPIVGGTGSHKPLAPNDTRPFRLPFDSLPDGWNQAMPKMVIARIAFAN